MLFRASDVIRFERLNGKFVKGVDCDIIEINIGKPLKVRVLEIKEFTKKEEAAALYEVV